MRLEGRESKRHSEGGEGERERDLEFTHLFVHFNVKAVGHLIILKHSRTTVIIHDGTKTKIKLSCVRYINLGGLFNDNNIMNISHVDMWLSFLKN